MRKNSSSNRFYKNLNPDIHYFGGRLKNSDITNIFRARTDLLNLNGNRFDANADKRCSLCNMNEEETLHHFLGVCPIMDDIRRHFLGRRRLTENELIDALNGEIWDWMVFSKFLKESICFRKDLILRTPVCSTHQTLKMRYCVTGLDNV